LTVAISNERRVAGQRPAGTRFRLIKVHARHSFLRPAPKWAAVRLPPNPTSAPNATALIGD
jgi:hypothetical protein